MCRGSTGGADPIDVQAPKQCDYAVGSTVEDAGPIGIFAYDLRDHPQIVRGAWRGDQRSAGARIVELEYNPVHVLEHDWRKPGWLPVGKCRVVSSEPALA
jgi:hypothetical protein